MKINEIDAVEHIVNSLDNEYGSWYDSENDVTWHIGTTGPGVVSITIASDDDAEIHNFRLVKEQICLF